MVLWHIPSEVFRSGTAPTPAQGCRDSDGGARRWPLPAFLSFWGPDLGGDCAPLLWGMELCPLVPCYSEGVRALQRTYMSWQISWTHQMKSCKNLSQEMAQNGPTETAGYWAEDLTPWWGLTPHSCLSYLCGKSGWQASDLGISWLILK